MVRLSEKKLFSLFNYEGDRFNTGSQQTRTVPSASARTGILNTGTSLGRIDIRPGSPNNTFGLPFDPAIVRLLSLYPLGNSPADSPLPGVFDTFRFSNIFHNKSDSTASRIDYRINDKHNLVGSYNFTNGTFDAGAETFPGLGDIIKSPQRGQVFSLTLVSNFTATLINEARFGFNRAKANFFGPSDAGVSSSLPDSINSAFRSAGYPLARPFGGPNGQAINLTGGTISGLGVFDTQRRFTGTTTVGDTVTYDVGSHDFKFGGEYRWIYSNSDTNFGRSETLSFNFPTLFQFPILRDNAGNDINPLTTVGGLISNYASFLYGLVAQQTQSQFFNKNRQRVDNDFRGFRTREFDWFFQDSWRIKSNFTLNYGLRYEYKGVPYEVNGQLSTLVNQDPSGVEPAGGFTFQLVGKNSGGSSDLWKKDLNNYAPRIGFNYSPNFQEGFLGKLFGGPGKTSIRGGYGVFYDRVFGNLFINARGNPPFQQDFFDFPGDTLDNISRPPTQVASPVVPSDAEIFPVIFALPGNNQFQKKFATPYEQKWSFGFQRELGNQFLWEADYVGAKGTNLLRVIDGQLSSVPRRNALTGSTTPISTSGTTNILNGRLNDAFFQVALNLANGFSTYHSLQTRVTKRLTNKTFGSADIQGAYTWSHSIDNSTDALVAQTGERSFPRDSSGFAGGFSRPERGNSGFDTRHRLVLNFVYDLPFNFENKALDLALGDFTISGIFTAQSGRPYSIFGSTDSAGSGLGQRADFGNGRNNFPETTLTPNPRVQTGPSRTLFTNPCPADSINTGTGGATVCTGPRRIGRQGNVGRNSFVGPAYNNFDFSVIKAFPITERVKFKIRADFFNLFNRVNFGQPVNTIISSNFGRSTGTFSPRIIQFAGRLDF